MLTCQGWKVVPDKKVKSGAGWAIVGSRVQLLISLLLGAICGAGCVVPALAQPKTHLEIDDYLKVNDYLVAPDRKSFAILQPDGNLCVFGGDEPQRKRAQLWCSGSARNHGDYYAILGSDANLCIFRGSAPPAHGRSGSSVWCWGDKEQVGGRFFLRVEGAALIAYEFLAFPGNAAGRPPRQLWASRKGTKTAVSGFASR